MRSTIWFGFAVMLVAALSAVMLMNYVADHPTSWLARLVQHAGSAQPLPGSGNSPASSVRITPVEVPPIAPAAIPLPDDLLSAEFDTGVRELEVIAALARNQLQEQGHSADAPAWTPCYPPDTTQTDAAWNFIDARSSNAPTPADVTYEVIPVDPYSSDEPVTIEVLPVAPAEIEEESVTPEGLLEIIPFLHEPMYYQWQIYPETLASSSGWWRFFGVLEGVVSYCAGPLARLFWFEEQKEPVHFAAGLPPRTFVVLPVEDVIAATGRGVGQGAWAQQGHGGRVDFGVPLPDVIRGQEVMPPPPCVPFCPGPCPVACCKEEMVRKVYPIRTFVKHKEEVNVDSLISILLQTVAPKSWVDNGGEGGVEYFPRGKCLVIYQTPKVHAEIAQLFEELMRCVQEHDAAEAAETAEVRTSIGIALSGVLASRVGVRQRQGGEGCAWFEQVLPLYCLPVFPVEWQRCETPENVPTPVEIDIDLMLPKIMKLFLPQVVEVEVLPIPTPEQLPECPEDARWGPHGQHAPVCPHQGECTRYSQPYYRHYHETPAAAPRATEPTEKRIGVEEPIEHPDIDGEPDEDAHWLEDTEQLETELDEQPAPPAPIPDAA